MQPQRTASEMLNTVFVKTPAGRAEIGSRAAGLSGRQRSLLIMLDGRKPLRGIDTLLAQQELADIAAFLQSAGLVEPQAAAAPAPAPARPVAVEPPIAEPPSDPAKLYHIKSLMTETARHYLGLMAADILRRVDGAANEAQLLSVLGHWHMAMRDSKHGKDVASVYLDEIKARFAAPALV